jgi:hypothetical protein
MRKDDITNLYNQVSPGVVLFDVFRPTYNQLSNVVFSFSCEKTTLQIYLFKQQIVCSRIDIVEEYNQLSNVVVSFSSEKATLQIYEFSLYIKCRIIVLTRKDDITNQYVGTTNGVLSF